MSIGRLYRKFNVKFFGDFQTYEGDPFYWMLDWGTVLYRTKFHKIMSEIICWTFMVLISFCCFSIFLHQPKAMELKYQLCVTLYFTYTFLSFNLVIRDFTFLKNEADEASILFFKARLPTKEFSKKVQLFSTSLKNVVQIVFFFGILIYFAVAISINKTNSLFFYFPSIVINSKIMYIFIVVIIGPYGIFFILIPYMVNCYFMGHVCYNLEMLNEEIKLLLKLENESDDSIILKYDELYQTIIENNLKYFSWQFNRIKRFNDRYNEGIKWKILITYSVGAIVISWSFNFIVENRFKTESVLFMGCFLLSSSLLCIICQFGEKMHLLCENFYNILLQLKWYNYSKHNSNLYLVLISQVKNPLTCNCYGFVILNRQLLLKVYRVLHTYATYFQSTRI